jgi:predicted P-loop ATPase
MSRYATASDVSRAFSGPNNPTQTGWYNFRCPAPGHKDTNASCGAKDGDKGGILVKCHAGCDPKAILAAIEAKGLKIKRSGDKKQPHELFADADPIGTAFPYFPARGLDAGAFPELASVVRYAPKCWHKESQTERPALIAAVTDGSGAALAIQRIYLTGDRRAKSGKPMSLGRIRSRAIRLGPPTETIYLGEGFEDAATAQQANGGDSAWAAVGAANLPNLVLPETTKAVVMLGQNDKTNPTRHDSTFARYASQAARKFSVAGKQVRIAWPAAGVKDINDLVRGKTGDELVQGYVRARAMLEDADKQTPSAPPSRSSWTEHALVDGHGQVMPIVANVLLALRLAPELADTLAYDELLRAAVLVKELPLTVGAKRIVGRPLPRPVIDEDVTQLQEWLQYAGMPRIGRDVVHQAIDRHSRDFSFHKLREWLDGLKWDGKRRLNTWLARYLGAKPSRYHAAIGRMFLIAMIARVFEPGCKADYVLILQGLQGELKSAVCQILGGEYFSDNMPDIRSKDASQHVRGLWLIELPELSALSRADVEAWKAFITRQTERYRQPYGRRESIEPRQCLFIGTTNKEEYLQDETGNRRFWPALIGVINLTALNRDREQLFAEAVHRYRNKDRWWPEREFESAYIAPEQEARFEEDAWEPLIAKWLSKHPEDKVLVHEVAFHAVSLENSRLGTADARRIRRVLHRLGWRQPAGRRRTADRFYYRPEKKKT